MMTRLDDYDVVVVGGGPGGFAGAVSAAREGAKTLLLEREGCLGGGATTMMVCPFMGHLTRPTEDGERIPVNAGIYKEITDALIEQGQGEAGNCIYVDDEYLKIHLDKMAREAGVKVVFHAALYDVEASDGNVTAALFAHNSGPIRAAGKVFIDGTGDALLAERAGAETEFGNEDGIVMPMTTKFVVGGVDTDVAPNCPKLKELAKASGDDDPQLINTNISCTRNRPNGRVHFNAIRVTGNTLDPFDLSRAEMEGRRRVENFVAWLKANVKGYENCFLDKMGAHIGVRESRRVMGDYVLTYDDWKNCAKFDDAIARCSYGIDIHGQKQGQTRQEAPPGGEYYHVPYRCLTPSRLDNVLVASRSISCDVAAHSSVRIMPPVMCIGQAAGLAAVMSLPGGVVREVDVAALQERIRAAGGLI